MRGVFSLSVKRMTLLMLSELFLTISLLQKLLDIIGIEFLHMRHNMLGYEGINQELIDGTLAIGVLNVVVGFFSIRIDS
jgi:hypothetical protein